MSWVTVVWSVNVGACLTLAMMYLAVWCRERELLRVSYFLYRGVCCPHCRI